MIWKEKLSERKVPADFADGRGNRLPFLRKYAKSGGEK